MCVAVPKVGCSTLKFAVHTLEDPRNEIQWWHTHADWPGWCVLDHPDPLVLEILSSAEWFKFCFVRNPYDRIVSAWKSKIVLEDDTHYSWLRDAVRETAHFPIDRAEPASFREAFDYVTGEDLVAGRDWHFRPQCDLLHPEVIAYDVIGRFENFAEDFRVIFERLDAPPHVLAMATTRYNATPHTNFRDFYDPELAARVYTFYEQDFVAFGYDRASWR
ncbi:MAG TPA: sulfotransferase family protein [Acidimicrobiales bacterium]|nr:sulfotransferase family protein [Acidimicrobiales bacterium]